MDGLLVDTERLCYRLWKRVYQEYGYEFKPDVYVRTVGGSAISSEAILKSVYGPQFPYLELRDQRNKYIDEEIAREGIAVKPGARELLDFLSAGNIPFSLATSTALARAREVLGFAGILERFEIIVAGDQVSQSKPDPEIFLKAAGLIAVPPENCVVLEDSPTGLRAACDARMIPVFVPDIISANEETARLAYATCSNLLDAQVLIESLIHG